MTKIRSQRKMPVGSELVIKPIFLKGITPLSRTKKYSRLSLEKYMSMVEHSRA